MVCDCAVLRVEVLSQRDFMARWFQKLLTKLEVVEKQNTIIMGGYKFDYETTAAITNDSKNVFLTSEGMMQTAENCQLSPHKDASRNDSSPVSSSLQPNATTTNIINNAFITERTNTDTPPLKMPKFELLDEEPRIESTGLSYSVGLPGISVVPVSTNGDVFSVPKRRVSDKYPGIAVSTFPVPPLTDRSDMSVVSVRSQATSKAVDKKGNSTVHKRTSKRANPEKSSTITVLPEGIRVSASSVKSELTLQKAGGSIELQSNQQPKKKECIRKSSRKSTQNESVKVQSEGVADVPPFKCEQCPYRAAAKYLLKRHSLLHSKHSMKPLFACNIDMCTYGAMDNAQLFLHQRAIHSAEGPDKS